MTDNVRGHPQAPPGICGYGYSPRDQVPAATPGLSLVIPAFNEAKRLARSLGAVVDDLRVRNAEVIVVDDGSADATHEAARKALSPLGERGRVVRLERHGGKGAAVRRGLLEARGRIVFFTDADLPYGLAAIDQGARVLESGECDVVAGERHQPAGARSGRSLLRDASSAAFRLMVRLLFRLPVRDTQCGLKGMTAAAARELAPLLVTEGFAFDVELLVRARRRGLRIAGLPVTLSDGHAGRAGVLTCAPSMLLDVLALHLWTWGLLADRPGDLRPDPRASAHASSVAVVLLAVLALGLYVPLLPLGFHGDDMHHLTEASHHSVPEMLFTRRGIQAISRAHFTPLLGVTFRVDWLCFGTNSWGYGLHSALWLALAGLGAYALLRRSGAGVLGSFLAGAIIVVAPATVSVAAYYSTRQYLAGLAWSLFSLAAMIEWRKTGRSRFLAAALALYSLALLCKELYFPLFAVAAALAPGGWKSRARVLGAYGALAVLYVVVRAVALKTAIGSYKGSQIEILPTLVYLVRSWPRFTETIFWSGGAPRLHWVPMVLGNVLIAVLLLLAHRAKGWRGVAALLVVGGASLCIPALVLDHPLLRYAERTETCYGDRLALAFTSAVLLSLAYLLFVPLGPWAGWRRQTLCAIFCALVVAAAACGASHCERKWRKLKLHAWQWRFVEENLRSDMIFVAPRPTHVQGFIDLVGSRAPDVRARVATSAGEADAAGSDWSRFHLLVPNQAIRRASGPEEAASWLKIFVPEEHHGTENRESQGP